ncbi:MAG: Asp-tRNA(Asn)/Glu-tRNA(Gln) amidotransferase subunit GatA [Gammaproteobacteria bacterium]
MDANFPTSVVEIAQGLKNRQFSSTELTQHLLTTIHAKDQVLNSFISVCDDYALAAATAADERRQRGDAGALVGVPYANKDIFCTRGVKTSCASKMLDNFISPYTATAIESMHQAGMVMLGKTNMDEFAMGSSNETSFYGAVKNPWDLGKVPGGSSGGSAAAVAARFTPCATGTDTGGSIRQPAALCGISGLKPTYGRVSRYGMIAFASSLDQGGPMAQSAADLALLLNVMAGYDAKDSTSLEQKPENFSAGLDDSLKGLTIGLPKEFFNDRMASEIAANLEAVRLELENLGAQFRSVSLPNISLSIPAYYVVASAECSSNLSRFDGVRYGYRCENPENLEDLYLRSRSEGFGREVIRRILVGTYALSSGYYDAFYRKAQQIRRLIKNDFIDAFQDVDVIMGPTTPGPAFGIGEKTSDPVSMYLSDVYTTAANLAGLPALSAPSGFLGGLPLGVQFIGNYLAESKLLNVAHRYQSVTNWHTKSPDTV